jgi:hypothetical protein
LNLLDNEIGDKVEGSSVQHNISTHNNPEYSMGMPIESSKVVVRQKIFVVWKIFYKNYANDWVIRKICKTVYAHKKGSGIRILDRHIKMSHKDCYENLLKQQ